MKPAEIYSVLKGINASGLYHANTVPTSCSFLEQGGLLSRAYVEKKQLTQTTQPSDAIDKKYGIWDRIFLDHVNIHYRAGAKKGPNQYGPVLFVLDLDVLLKLPSTTDLFVTKQNPIHWHDGEDTAARFYLTVDELSQNLSFGNFDKMLVIKTPTGRLDFPDKKVQIFLDNPQRTMASGEDAYSHAEKRLKAAARKGIVTISIRPHECSVNGICVRRYTRYDGAFFDSQFA
jgi:hypothetical protein